MVRTRAVLCHVLCRKTLTTAGGGATVSPVKRVQAPRIDQRYLDKSSRIRSAEEEDDRWKGSICNGTTPGYLVDVHDRL
ncbi:uncharacterized protein B0H18DRAFT_1050395, partial [Fomitopsis serialis]|uniref:uncharacterized protein n=1 Tax=Fomitopsis serialis TaxID=139415 RepID=UPI0020080FD9